MWRQKTKRQRSVCGCCCRHSCSLWSDSWVKERRSSSEFHESAGGSGKGSVCSAIRTDRQTDRQADGRETDSKRQKDRWTDVTFCRIVILAFQQNICAAVCSLNHARLFLDPPPTPQQGSHIEQCRGRSWLFVPWPWHSTICHTHQASMAVGWVKVKRTKKKKKKSEWCWCVVALLKIAVIFTQQLSADVVSLQNLVTSVCI